MPNETNGTRTNKSSDRPEIRLKAKAVSRGLAIGNVICLVGRNRQYYRRHIEPDKVDTEIRRVKAAFRLASRQLKLLADSSAGGTPGVGRTIFETHLLILKDPGLLSKIIEKISSESVNSEWAVRVVFDEYISRYKAIDDDHLREKYLDIEDISERLLSALGGGKATAGLEAGSIIAARELRPSTVVELHQYNPLALITEHGGWTSHSFILARELNIPAVTGLKKILRKLRSGDRVIVDGYDGNVVLNPTGQTEKEILSDRSANIRRVQENAVELNGQAETLDGYKVEILVNADLPPFPDDVLGNSKFGVGLFRTEYLFNRYGGYPSENQQYTTYRALAKKAGGARVKIRTFDIDVGQLIDRTEDREVNPALGLRAIRLGLTYPRELSVQIRAILRAAYENPIDIVLPLVSGVSEIKECKKLVEKQHLELQKAGKKAGYPLLGAMIEVPSAVFAIDDILEEVDFVCLGTNDLTQYILATDRDNETVANWYRTLHPAVLKAIKTVILAGRSADKPVIVCGEMAGSPFYLPILLGFGARHLSMNTNSITRITKLITGIAYSEAVELAKRIEKLKTPDEVEAELRSAIAEQWAHLFPDDLIK